MGSIAVSQGEAFDYLYTNMYAFDQGWGGENGNWTHSFVQLTENGNSLWSVQVAGAVHTPAWDSYTASSTDLAALNTAINSIDWTTSPTVSLDLDANIQAYSGWAGNFQNATMTVGTPEPGTIFLAAGAGLMLLGFRRKKA
jgi:hypothetical protein